MGMSEENLPGDVIRTPRRAIAGPLRLGFTVTVGGLIALALGGALASLSSVLVTVGVALFVAMALEPLVQKLQKRGVGRGLGIVIVFVVFALLIVGLLAIVVPVAISQIGELIVQAPAFIRSLEQQAWYERIVDATGQADLYSELLTQLQRWISNPANLAALGGGALAIGSSLVEALSGGLLTLVLTLYFLASLEQVKGAVVRLSPAYVRPRVSRVTDQLTTAVGGYVSGMAVLAFCNAVVCFLMLSAIGVPFAALLGALALVVTMIPMIGSVMQWIIASIVALFTVGWIALVFVIVYFAYMQVEAYLMTPRIMTKAVSVPGALVLIGALVGGALLGLLGVLIAVPITASILMVINEMVVPVQDAKTTAEL